MKRLLIIFILLTSIHFISCSDNQPKSIINKTDNPMCYQVTGHIWYIKDVGQDFCKRYETFLKKDLPEGFNVAQIVGDGSGGYGKNRGYFIIIEEKNK